jgi:hypothetical protein
MNTKLPGTTIKFSVLAIGAALAMSTAGTVAEETQPAFLKDAKTELTFRYRYEGVDQDGIDNNASANTLRTRLKWTSGKQNNINAVLEFDDLRSIGSERYNSTSNGNTTFPVVADPEGTEVNQAFLQYDNGGFTARAGRQGIILDDQRFVGTVGWRQNEQTFDALRLQYKQDNFNIDYSYVGNVNRIFGPDGPKADLEGNVQLLNAGLAINKQHKLVAFNYLLDFDDAAALSSNSWGLRYNGTFGPVNLTASYARQSDAADNPVSYDADYMLLEVGTKVQNVTLKAGYEVLGSDDGIAAFTTPLATLHKFQGFADKFLATPKNGVQDLYFMAATKVSGVTLKLFYHQLESDHGSVDYGSEWDAVVAYPVNKRFTTLLKYANYSADDHASDTQKIWLQLQYKL